MEKVLEELRLLYKERDAIEYKIKKLEKKVESSSSFELKLSDKIYIPIRFLSTEIIKELKELAIFDNPQIKILQQLRRPIYNTPKKIISFELINNILILPRGLMKDVIILLKKNNIDYKLVDNRFTKKESFPTIKFELRPKQQVVIDTLVKKDFSIFVAPPGFGKTLIGSKMIEIRKVNTLIVVNKNLLLDQWIDRFTSYFNDITKKDIGYLGKGKNKLNGKLDIATMQSLKNNPELIQNYSFVIVDECHHIPAVTFESIIKEFRGKYILGLSATPMRKDGMDPILFQQLGNIAYEVKKEKGNNNIVQVVQSDFTSEVETFTELMGEIVQDMERNRLIVEQILKNKDRKLLVLSDRIEHIEIIENILRDYNQDFVTIHGSLKKKQKEENLEKIESSNLVLATTSYFGEGIDFPHLNTILFATPISFYGRLIQYLGRVGRSGEDCIAIDILDSKNNFTNSAFRKRKEGYKELHYKITFEE
ncbi:MAG TPA: DEAD/DEAH box helicase [Arcobacter sp.]|jgi:superfamily II DNA or RNA helicase|nr:DEAD/DEAH box helicase [Arcobacter sp.]